MFNIIIYRLYYYNILYLYTAAPLLFRWNLKLGSAHCWTWGWVACVLGLSEDFWVPSGKLTVCYWKWPSRNSGFTHIKMVIFHSFLYVYQAGYFKKTMIYHEFPYPSAISGENNGKKTMFRPTHVYYILLIRMNIYYQVTHSHVSGKVNWLSAGRDCKDRYSKAMTDNKKANTHRWNESGQTHK